MPRQSASSLLLLPMPGSPSSSWALFGARLASVFRNPDLAVLLAFWLFGLMNNVLYVLILSAAQDLVGSDVPKGLVLLADILPSFCTKLVAPYFIHYVPYWVRVIVFAACSASSMLIVALTPHDQSVGIKLVGVTFASFASGAGELSFLGLTHFYGQLSLAAWGSGTGAAGLAGAGLYVVLTDWIGLSVKDSLLAAACLPVLMLLAFFVILPRGPLRDSQRTKQYQPVPEALDDAPDDIEDTDADSALLASGPKAASSELSGGNQDIWARVRENLLRVKSLFFPYMLPLLLVYVAEYVINQGVSPTLLFPLKSSPFSEYRDFYPMYGFIYQVGVFISRTSVAFLRIRHLYLPSFLQVGNLVLLTLHALLNFIPSVYIIFVIIFWEGLLGGAVYVNTFADIMENVPVTEREFSLGATSVSDSAGICIELSRFILDCQVVGAGGCGTIGPAGPTLVQRHGMPIYHSGSLTSYFRRPLFDTTFRSVEL